MLTLGEAQKVLQNLLRERVSVRNLEVIFETLADFGSRTKDPEVLTEYHWISEYAPYENVDRVDYPPLLVTAGLNDPRVSYWEPAKWVQLLRERSTSDAEILLKTEMSAGHFARSGRYDLWRDEAIVLAFVLSRLGIDR